MVACLGYLFDIRSQFPKFQILSPRAKSGKLINLIKKQENAHFFQFKMKI